MPPVGRAVLRTAPRGRRHAGRAAARARRGRLLRVRTGWYAVPGAKSQVVEAVRIGGRLTSESLFSQLGCWSMPGARLHVAVDHGTRVSPAVRASGARIHWRPHGAARLGPGIEPLSTALGDLLHEDLTTVVVVVDSILDRGIMRLSDVRGLLGASDRGRMVLAHVEQGSQAGTESLMRLGLRAAGLRVRIQVWIAGVGRVDLLVGDRLIIEVDGREHHDSPSQFEADRRRDAALKVRGFEVLRFSYRQVMFDRAECIRVVLDCVGVGAHRWTSRTLRLYESHRDA